MRNIRSQLHAAKTLVLLSKVQPPSLLHTNHGGASHRDVHKYVPAKLDVEYHRLMRMVVGPPAGTNWHHHGKCRYCTCIKPEHEEAVGPCWSESVAFSVICTQAVRSER